MEIDYNDLDLDRLRSDLQDYFTSAYFMVSPLAIMELSQIDDATDIELIKMAQKNGFSLKKYIKFYRR